MAIGLFLKAAGERIQTKIWQSMRTETERDKLFDPEFFEHVPCNLCGESDANAEVVFEADTEKAPRTREEFFNIYSSSGDGPLYERAVRCRRCSLVYLSPRPKGALIIKGYSCAKDERYVSQEEGRGITFRNSLKKITRLRPRGKLLDVGAASGTFVSMAVEAGYDAYGVEPSGWMCDFAKKNYGLRVLQGVLEEQNFKDASFDIVTMWDVLEHVPDPMATLREVMRILVPDGLLFINYPRIDDPLARLAGRKWWFLLSIHLYYFTPRTLSAYLDLLEFEKVLHRMHLQRLAYDYLIERLIVYSPMLAKAGKLLYRIPGFTKAQIPYFACQYLMIARKKR